MLRARTASVVTSMPTTRAMPGGQPDAGREHADRGRLAGTVGAEEPKHLAPLDGERDAVHGIRAAPSDSASGAPPPRPQTAPDRRRRDLKRRTHRREE